MAGTLPFVRSNNDTMYDSREAAFAALTTTPGSEFEVAPQDVLGTTVHGFINLPNNLGALLHHSRSHGDKDYLICGERTYSFEQHFQSVTTLASLLATEYGIRKGDRVAIFSFNRPEWIIAFWAITSLGGIVVAGNSMGVARELQHQVDLTDPVLILSDDALAERLASCDLDGRAHVNLITLVGRADASPVLDAASPAEVDLDDPAVIIFTSGTTGSPKGATHTHRNLITAVWFHRLNDAVSTATGAPPPHRRYLLVSPLFHIASLHNLAVVRLVTGDTAVIHEGRFSAQGILQLIEHHRITNWGAVPTMINRVLHEDLSKYDLSSLQVLTINSAPSSPNLQEEVRRRLPHVARAFGTSYGLTESSSAATIGTPEMLARHPESVGKPVVTMELRIREPSGRDAADGVEGEIHIRGPLVMLGYWGSPGRDGIDEDGWFATGDLGYISGGELHMRSRRSDLILRGAENIYPAEVENVLSSFPGVIEAAVVGLPDEDFGQVVAAFVVVKDLATFDQAGLRHHVEEKLARYKRPEYLHFLEGELPKNPTGKVIRSGLDYSVFGATND